MTQVHFSYRCSPLLRAKVLAETGTDPGTDGYLRVEMSELEPQLRARIVEALGLPEYSHSEPKGPRYTLHYQSAPPEFSDWGEPEIRDHSQSLVLDDLLTLDSLPAIISARMAEKRVIESMQPELARRKADYNTQKAEVVVLRNYLGKYDLVFEVY